MAGEIVRACIAAAMMLAACAGSEQAEKLYIVYMDKSQMPSIFLSEHDWYKSVVLSCMDVMREGDMDRKLVYTYDIVMHGFSALLTSSEMEAVRAVPGYVRSHEDTGKELVLDGEELKQRWGQRRLLTTHSYQFLRLSQDKGLWPQSEFGAANDIIVGVVDSGIWPESPSFVEDGMDPVPAKWKGTCQPGVDFDASLCNKKLIGARYFHKGFLALGKTLNLKEDYNSARDYIGHGTFIASIIAGHEIPNANVFGYGYGTMKGIAPRARVAVYKVLWSDSTSSQTNKIISNSDVINAINQAVADGVDILSISLGLQNSVESYTDDSIVVQSLEAMKNGVLVVASSGNQGPEVGTVHNEAPWLLTVGATTMDRVFLARIDLGDEVVLKGISMYMSEVAYTPVLALVSGDICLENSLDPRYVTGNVLLCLDSPDVSVYSRMRVAKNTGAIAAIIVYEDALEIPPSNYLLPVVFVNAKQSELIVEYLSTTSAPIVSLQFQITELDYTPAPVLGSFSSVGPSRIFPEIVKPDLVGPGVNIIAACPTNSKRRRGRCFHLKSGTSFSTPHVAGLAALLKAVHPNWSPAAIKSALMTTASKSDNTGHFITAANTSARTLSPLDIGCGHVAPEKAVDPGLIYDMGYQDYVNYLCLTNRKTGSDCNNAVGSPYDLNLATFAVNFFNVTEPGEKQTQSFKRVLTNVGGGNGVYKAFIYPVGDINVTVTPETLVFNQTNQKLEFTLTMELDGPSLVTDRVRHGYLIWSDGWSEESHQVISPFVAIFPDNYIITV